MRRPYPTTMEAMSVTRPARDAVKRSELLDLLAVSAIASPLPGIPGRAYMMALNHSERARETLDAA
jgi:hypothetical protein